MNPRRIQWIWTTRGWSQDINKGKWWDGTSCNFLRPSVQHASIIQSNSSNVTMTWAAQLWGWKLDGSGRRSSEPIKHSIPRQQNKLLDSLWPSCLQHWEATIKTLWDWAGFKGKVRAGTLCQTMLLGGVTSKAGKSLSQLVLIKKDQSVEKTKKKIAKVVLVCNDDLWTWREPRPGWLEPKKKTGEKQWGAAVSVHPLRFSRNLVS